MAYDFKDFEKTTTMAIKLNVKKLTLLKYDYLNDISIFII